MMNRYKIVIATHKKYNMPSDTELYLPVQSGAAISSVLGYQRDNVGDNISCKNKEYNELCVMYWAWKNLDADYIGVVHYRRHFLSLSNTGNGINNCITLEEITELFKKYDIILPKKNRYPVSIEKHYIYSYAGNKKILKEDLDSLRKAIQNVEPEFCKSLEKVLRSHSAHMYHMCIMKREHYNDYCKFMFSITDEIENIRGERNPSDRYIGGLSELILDIWIENKNLKIKELMILELEKDQIYKRIFKVARRMFLKDDRIWDEKRIGGTK